MTLVFRDLIQADPNICNNCFRRTHETYERNYAVDTYRDGGDTKLWARQIEAPDRSYPESVTYIPNDLASHGTSVVCECGCPEAIRPVSTRKAISHAKRLCDRLEEKGVDFDEDTVLDVTRELLSQPENQGTQDDVFKYAVTRSTCTSR